MNEQLKTIITVKWEVTKDTLFAITLGLVVIINSILLLFLPEDEVLRDISFFILRDVIMIAVLGIFVPLFYIKYIKGEEYESVGLTTKRWQLSIMLNIILFIFFLLMFTSEDPSGIENLFSVNALSPIFYIMITGIFELIFFYGFIRERLERAFGIIPAILLTSIFYSFHHVGFQPEFFKLIFVGIMYASIHRVTKSALAIYPLAWGIGATWDVLISFDAMDDLANAWISAILLLLLIITIFYTIEKDLLSRFVKKT